MHVLNGKRRLVEELKGFNLTEPLVLVEVVEEVAELRVFQHDVHLLLLLKDFVEFNDVRVT